MPQPRGQRPPKAQAGRVGQEGNSWVGDRPAPDEFASWFGRNVPIDEALNADHYIGGLVLITGKETRPELNRDGAIQQVERLVHKPYAKVETRVQYFYDLCSAHGWLAVIEPVPQRRVNAQGMFNEHLPEGFFRHQVRTDAGQFVEYIGCQMRAGIYEPDARSGGRGRPVRISPPMTKTLPPLVRRYEAVAPDEYLLLKCETGAIGRALGAAGILNIPGSGIATAEDMLEMQSGDRAAGVEPELLPSSGPQSEPQSKPDVAGRIAELAARLESEQPDKADAFAEWLAGRDININDVRESQQRAVLAWLEKAL